MDMLVQIPRSLGQEPVGKPHTYPPLHGAEGGWLQHLALSPRVCGPHVGPGTAVALW